MVEKNHPHEKGRKKNTQPFTISVSRFTLLQKKKKQLYWKQMLTLCQLLKMERVYLNRCSYKEVLMAVRIPVIDHLLNRQKDSRKQKLFETKIEISLPVLICRTLRTQFSLLLLFLFCFLSFRIKKTSFRKCKACLRKKLKFIS